MTHESLQKWLPLASKAIQDPRAPIPCPNNEEDMLVIFDIIINDVAVSRYLYCPSCGAKNVIELRNESASNRVLPYVSLDIRDGREYTFDEIVDIHFKAMKGQ